MKAEELLKTIYLGDRSCKGIHIEGWRRQVAVQVDLISRIRSATGTWDGDAKEDISDGLLVFTGVTSLAFEPMGPIPNDLINEIQLTRTNDAHSGKEALAVSMSISSVDEKGNSTEVIVTVQAEDVHLEDPSRPGEALR